MKAYIRYIMTFGDKNKKRFIKLNDGVNIITGDSKSGKTALMEIIDYCLASSKSTIPVGKITEFSKLYAIAIEIGENVCILAREPYYPHGKKRMFLKIENKNFVSRVENLTQSYFSEDFFEPIDYIKVRIGDVFGLKVNDPTEESEAERKKERPSIRNIVSYIFQHQNLVASKFAMFYRFNDPIEREQVIDQFPVFAGIVDQNYFYLKQEKDRLDKELRRKTRDKNNMIKYMKEKESELVYDLKDYYDIIGIELKEENLLENLKKHVSELPELTSDSYTNNTIETKFKELEQKLEELKANRDGIQLEIENLKVSINYGQTYSNTLEELRGKSALISINDHYECPICSSRIDDINKKVEKLHKAKEWLMEEMVFVENDKEHHFQTAIIDLEKQKKAIENQMKLVKREYDNILETHKFLKEHKSLQVRTIYAKLKIEESVKLINGDKLEDINSEIKRIANDLKDVNKKIDLYNINSYLKEAEVTIQNFMNSVVDKLDFELELKPVNLKFELDKFSFYQYMEKSRERIYLSSMGSAANWLSCHLGLFFGLLYYFCKRGVKSSVPAILFIDQPSQVYFPDNRRKKSEDIKQVENIYNVILSSVDKIKDDTGILPQIIITDHADNLTLEKYDFEKLVDGRRWRNNKKFI